MRVFLPGMLIFSSAIATAIGADDGSPREQYEALNRAYDAAEKAAGARPQAQDYAARFFALAEEHPDDPAALDSLIWVASRSVFGPEAEKVLGRIARDHARSDRLKDFCGECSRYGEPFAPFEAMLRAVLADTPHREVEAAASLSLACYLKMAKETTECHLVRALFQDDRVMSRKSPQTLENFDRVRRRGLDKVEAESAALFQRVIDRYAGIRVESNFPADASEFAKGQLFELRHLSIGKQAPGIVGKDIEGRPMDLARYAGKVVVLDFGSHRSCGVCRQWYPALRSFVDRYKNQPVALLGISVDDDPEELKALTKQGEITWPIWSDGANLEGPIASRWVIQAMPTFYVLDHKGVIRNKGCRDPAEISGTVDLLLKEMQAGAPKAGLAPRAFDGRPDTSPEGKRFP